MADHKYPAQSLRWLMMDSDFYASDPVLGSIAPRARVATPGASPTVPGHDLFDIRLHGEGETVFIDI